MSGHNARRCCSQDHRPPRVPPAQRRRRPRTGPLLQKPSAPSASRRVRPAFERSKPFILTSWHSRSGPCRSPRTTVPGQMFAYGRGGLERESAYPVPARGLGCWPVIEAEAHWPAHPSTRRCAAAQGERPSHRSSRVASAGRVSRERFFPRWVQGAARLQWRVEDRLFIRCPPSRA